MLRSQFVEADGDGLAQIHGGLAGTGGNFDEEMASSEVIASEAALFRAKEDSDAAAACDFALDDGRQIREGDDRLVGLAAIERCGADDEGGIGDGLGDGCRFVGGLQKIFGANGGFGFAPVVFIRRNDGKAIEAEVGHGASSRPYIEGVARRDEDDGEAGEARNWVIHRGDKSRSCRSSR